MTSLAPPKGFPDVNWRALGVPAGGVPRRELESVGGSRRWRMKQGEESAAVEKIKYSRGSGTQIFSGTASGIGGPGFPKNEVRVFGGSREGSPKSAKRTIRRR